MTGPAARKSRGVLGSDPPCEQLPPIPKHIGLCRFGRLGAWITVQCPEEFNPLMAKAGAVWDPGERRWLVRLHRLSPVLRKLRRHTGLYSARPWPQRTNP